ncbi:hypothetical protein BDV59DRAFT_178184 [Aspergillus ambiguus]|uniref:uncharacterized protein n=1 Tax=Aspergillus ambiguus TaxID=176160 RepID=UPI003CCD7E71
MDWNTFEHSEAVQVYLCSSSLFVSGMVSTSAFLPYGGGRYRERGMVRGLQNI